MLIQAGADVNARSANGRTPLSFAVEENEPEIVSLLLAAGADVNAKNKSGSTALIIAAMENNNPEVLNVLIQAGADVTEADLEAAQNNENLKDTAIIAELKKNLKK